MGGPRRDENGFLADIPVCCNIQMQPTASGVDCDGRPYERFYCKKCGERAEF